MVSTRPLNILLVDDDDADAELTLNTLRKADSTITITRCRDGEEALACVFRDGAFRDRKRGLPDLILPDLKMPQVGGIDVLQTLKSDELTRGIAIVILTGSASEKTRLESAQLGAAGYLLKPIRPEDLIAWPK